MTGPLQGVRIIEFAGLGPGPFCGMMLADHGAEVIHVDRIGTNVLIPDPKKEFLNRSRKSIKVDLKSAEGIAIVRKLCASADGIIEGYRPGVMERLGLGPDVLLADNPKLAYGRMTGWGQDGPYANMAGHDINYVALSGALHATGRAGQRPTPAMNLIGDFGGGGMMLAFGMLAAIVNARSTGQGQVVDCAMTEGSAVLMTMIYSNMAKGQWRDERGVNMLDSGCHFYDTYETADGKFISIGPVEPQFYRILLELTGLITDEEFATQHDPKLWPELKEKVDACFLTKTRDQWCEILEGTDACFAPVLSMTEAPKHPHNVARKAFVDVEGTTQPAPTPRFSRTVSDAPTMLKGGADIASPLLKELGYSDAEVAQMQEQRVWA